MITVDDLLSILIKRPNRLNDELDPDRIVLLQQFISRLSSKEEFVLVNHYGLSGESRKTLDEIGRQLHVSKARIGQIEKRVLSKARTLLPEDYIRKTYELSISEQPIRFQYDDGYDDPIIINRRLVDK